MPMVIYGIGSIELYEPPRLQLSIAMLMKRDFNWIGNIEVFDPILSATESRVLEALGCTVMANPFVFYFIYFLFFLFLNKFQ
jgi:hypothetical protein